MDVEDKLAWLNGWRSYTTNTHSYIHKQAQTLRCSLVQCNVCKCMSVNPFSHACYCASRCCFQMSFTIVSLLEFLAEMFDENFVCVLLLLSFFLLCNEGNIWNWHLTFFWCCYSIITTKTKIRMVEAFVWKVVGEVADNDFFKYLIVYFYFYIEYLVLIWLRIGEKHQNS